MKAADRYLPWSAIYSLRSPASMAMPARPSNQEAMPGKQVGGGCKVYDLAVILAERAGRPTITHNG